MISSGAGRWVIEQRVNKLQRGGGMVISSVVAWRVIWALGVHTVLRVSPIIM